MRADVQKGDAVAGACCCCNLEVWPTGRRIGEVACLGVKSWMLRPTCVAGSGLLGSSAVVSFRTLAPGSACTAAGEVLGCVSRRAG